MIVATRCHHSSTKLLNFIYSEKATKLCGISTLLLSKVHTVKGKVEFFQNFVAFAEYMSFTVYYSDAASRVGGL
jgi:hypothetical protein